MIYKQEVAIKKKKEIEEGKKKKAAKRLKSAKQKQTQNKIRHKQELLQKGVNAYSQKKKEVW